MGQIAGLRDSGPDMDSLERARDGVTSMGGAARFGLAVTAAAHLCVAAAAHAQAQSCLPGAIGVQRVIEIDAKGGPRFGHQQYPGPELLGDREVVLTFDDGPHKLYTKPILDVLDANCTKATFFMVGQRAMSYPDLAREVARRGHTIGTHTWSHRDLAKTDSEAARTDIELGISAVQRVVGAGAAPFFRFPYLSHGRVTTSHLQARNMAIFSIDVDSYDFKTRSPTKMISNVVRQLEAKGRGILLFHDIQPSTAEGLSDLLFELKVRGFRVVHLVPRQGQVTVAEYDRRIARDYGGGRVAMGPIPVAQRSVVSRDWDARVSQQSPSARLEPTYVPVNAAIAPPAAPAPPPRATPSRANDDWMKSIFRFW